MTVHGFFFYQTYLCGSHCPVDLAIVSMVTTDQVISKQLICQPLPHVVVVVHAEEAISAHITQDPLARRCSNLNCNNDITQWH